MIIIYVKMNKSYVKLPRELFGRFSQIVLETIASLNAMRRQKERLIEITVDGKITGDELADFVHIQDELEKNLRSGGNAAALVRTDAGHRCH